MQPQSTRKEPVTIGDVKVVILVPSGGHDGPGRDLAPGLQICRAVTDYRLFAGGAAGGVDLRDLLGRKRKHTVRIVVPQILLGGKRQLGQILHRADILGLNPGRVHLGTVGSYVIIDPADRIRQPLSLKGQHFIPGHGFHFFVEEFAHCCPQPFR